jgi:hypothetical protein
MAVVGIDLAMAHSFCAQGMPLGRGPSLATRFIGVRFARFSASLKVLLPCAKNWQPMPGWLLHQQAAMAGGAELPAAQGGTGTIPL